VVFPEKDMKYHIEDKVRKGLRGKPVSYWERVWREMKEVFEPIKSTEAFNTILFVRKKNETQ